MIKQREMEGLKRGGSPSWTVSEEDIEMFQQKTQKQNNKKSAAGVQKNEFMEELTQEQPPRKRLGFFLCFLAAFFIMVVVLLISLTMNHVTPYPAAAPVFPEKMSYEEQKDLQGTEKLEDGFLENLRSFSGKTASLLFPAQEGENVLYSPVSLYMALAMLTEGAAGETQTELLAAMEADSVQNMGDQAEKLFRNLYFDNEIGKMKMGNSLWMNERYQFEESYIQTLAKNYYAYSYCLPFGTQSTNKKISEWLSDQTEGELGGAFKTHGDEALLLINTVYFYDEWSNTFEKNQTMEDDFYLANGETVKGEFMNMTLKRPYLELPSCQVSSLTYKNGCQMIFLLPKEGIRAEKLMEDTTLLEEVLLTLQQSNDMVDVAYHVPKFSYSVSQVDLIPTLEKLGIQSVFDDRADLSGISQQHGLYVSAVKQSASITVDEKGSEAAAATAIIVKESSAALLEDTIQFELERPFVYLIISDNGVPLFIGILNNPTD